MSEIFLEAGKNVYIAEAYPNRNFVALPNLFFSRYTHDRDRYRTLLFFDLNQTMMFQISQLTINSAKLRLHVYRNEIPSCQSGITVGVHRLLSDFTESSATWNNSPAISRTADGTAIIAAGFLGTLDIDITPLFRGWLEGSIVNNGLMLIGEESTNAVVGIRGNRFEDSGTWPRLVVDYVQGKLIRRPAETLAVPPCGKAFSAAVELGGTRRRASFLVRNEGSEEIVAVPQISDPELGYVSAGQPQHISPGADTVINLDYPGEAARMAIETSATQAESIARVVKLVRED